MCCIFGSFAIEKCRIFPDFCIVYKKTPEIVLKITDHPWLCRGLCRKWLLPRPWCDPHVSSLAQPVFACDSHTCSDRLLVIRRSTDAEWATFFEEGTGGYTDYILHMAALAERTNCSILSVAVEIGAQEMHMRTLIGEVRTMCFTGSRTTASREFTHVPRTCATSGLTA